MSALQSRGIVALGTGIAGLVPCVILFFKKKWWMGISVLGICLLLAIAIREYSEAVQESNLVFVHLFKIDFWFIHLDCSVRKFYIIMAVILLPMLWFAFKWRETFVAIKRKPQTIPLTGVILSFVWYSFNLSLTAFTTSRLQGNNMGLTGFAIMLFSTLSMVCCINAFPYRKKAKVPMLILLFVMLEIVFVCDIHYLVCIVGKLGAGTISNSEVLQKIEKARTVILVHMIIVRLSIYLIVALPGYSKLLRKIKTSIEVEENSEMEAIDISGE